MKDIWEILTAESMTNKVRWFAKLGDTSLGGVATDPAGLERAARLSEVEYNVYCTLNPSTDRRCKRINNLDVTHWAFVFVDLDFVPLGINDAPMDAVSHWLRSTLHTIHPTLDPAIVFSGRGIQGWVRLTPIRVLTTTIYNHDFYARVNRGLLLYLRESLPSGWRIDMLPDLARIARLPMSKHQTTGQYAQLLNPGSVATREASNVLIERFASSAPIVPPPQTYDSVHIDTAFGAREWVDVRDELTLAAKTFIELGAPEGERHRNCHHACKTLKERGVSKKSAFEALIYGSAACSKPLSEREVRSILEQEYGKESK